MKAVFIMGVCEFHNLVIPKNILEYFGLQIYYKEIDNPSNWPILTAGIAAAAGIDLISSNDNVIYGIEITPVQTEDQFDKTMAEHSVFNFIDFMYKHYKLEYDHPTEIMAITDIEMNHRFLESEITPDDINIHEYNITISLNRSGKNIVKEIKEMFMIEIAKAGFKLNMDSLYIEDKDHNNKIQFNINTPSDIKTWSNAMRRKIKKKYNIIESFKCSEQFHLDLIKV